MLFPFQYRLDLSKKMPSSKKKVQEGNDQEKDSHTKNRGGKKQTNNKVLIP